MVDYGLKNKVVLITGTNNPKGIGSACALAFAKQGAKVALVYKKLSFPYDDKEYPRRWFRFVLKKFVRRLF